MEIQVILDASKKRRKSHQTHQSRVAMVITAAAISASTKVANMVPMGHQCISKNIEVPTMASMEAYMGRAAGLRILVY